MKKQNPHEAAQEITLENLAAMRKGSRNEAHVGGGEQGAAAAHALLSSNRLCGTCARLSVDPETSQIGCSYDFASPSTLARQLTGGTFLHELECEGFVTVTKETETYVDEDGVLRYRYQR